MQDNYCAPTYGVFYEHLLVETARDLRHWFAFHCTPERGSWLNVAEIELAALSRQCLDRRIGCPHQLEQEALAWQANRNEAALKINWSFITEKAREKLKNRHAEPPKTTIKVKLVNH